MLPTSSLSEEHPRAGNTGVQSPSGDNPMGVTPGEESVTWHLDWLEVTYPSGRDPFTLLPGIASGAWRAEERGRLGYKARYTYAGAELLTAGTEAMGHHIALGGTAIRYLCHPPVSLDLAAITADVAEGRCGCSRIDVALDCFTQPDLLDQVEQAWQADHCTSRWRQAHIIRGAKRGGKYDQGATWYAGDKTSDARCRIYDKKAERLAKGKREEALSRQYPDTWIRVEYQLRNETAEAACRLLHTTGRGALAEALLGYLAFRTPTGDHDKSRWPVAAWWAEVVGTVRRRPLKVPRPDGTLDDTRAWLETQAAPSLAAITEAAGGDLSELARLAREGRWRIGAKLRRRLDTAGIGGNTQGEQPIDTDSEQAQDGTAGTAERGPSRGG